MTKRQRGRPATGRVTVQVRLHAATVRKLRLAYANHGLRPGEILEALLARHGLPVE